MSRSFVKKLGILMGIVLLIIAILVSLFLLIFTLKDYQPEKVETISKSENVELLDVNLSFKLLSWNIGYAGLNKEMDFFYDGGKMVRPMQSKVEENLNAILSVLQNHNDADFIFLQEIDVDSKRSYNMNELEYFKKGLPNYHTSYATNYKVLFVPSPLSQPMGKVEAGLATFSKTKAMLSQRHTFPFNFSWPLKIFMLDRCFITYEIATSNNKKLILINTHNSAFDGTGNLPKSELAFLREYMQREYNNGNYVILGGDFNLAPITFTKDDFKGLYDIENAISMPNDAFNKDWQIIYDSQVPSNRSTATTYQKEGTKVYCIDFFIVSPNIKIDAIRCLDLGFENSDHNPVITTFKLLK